MVVAIIIFVVTVYQKRSTGEIEHSSDHAPLYSLEDEEDGDGQTGFGANGIDTDVSHFDEANSQARVHPKKYAPLPSS